MDLNQIWNTIAPYVTGVSLSAVVTAVVCGFLKGAIGKTMSKLNVEKISQNATEKGIEKIKNVSFTQSIQPLVVSEMKKVAEQAEEISKQELIKVQEKYDKIIVILSKLSAYFDDSIGVTETAKEELRQALITALNAPTTAESVIVEEIPKEVASEPLKAKEKPKKAIKVER